MRIESANQNYILKAKSCMCSCKTILPDVLWILSCKWKCNLFFLFTTPIHVKHYYAIIVICIQLTTSLFKLLWRRQTKIFFSNAATKLPLILDRIPESDFKIWRKISPIISKSLSANVNFGNFVLKRLDGVVKYVSKLSFLKPYTHPYGFYWGY